jgi:Glycosyl hydrolases family 2, TIM barrel domain/Glycosyl hydrolases family 2, sugar binding domain/Glycosyl hydrolases family 2
LSLGSSPPLNVSSTDSVASEDLAVTSHPRPLLRRNWVDLSGPWEFRYDDEDAGLAGGWWREWPSTNTRIEVPYPPESKLSGIQDRGFHPVLWYRRTITCLSRPGRRVLLHFGAVDYRAVVWLDGRRVAEHGGGHTPFSADLTDVLGDAEEHEVVVRVEDEPGDLGQPRGKQDWQLEPHVIWYHRSSGIWQTVWLEEVADVHIRSLQWTPDLQSGTLTLSARVSRTEPGTRLRVQLRLRGQLLADDAYAVLAEETTRRIQLPKAWLTLSPREVLWAPDHPNLLDAQLQLTDAGDAILDDVTSYCALRSVRAVQDQFELNGQPYFLRLVLEQGYWPESHLAAPRPEALRQEVELVKSLGFNGVRVHQKIAQPEFLYWCDRLGLIVWAEMPAAYEFSPQTTGRIVREWLEVLERDRSHPCVAVWVPFNESWGVPDVRTSEAQQDLVRTLYHLTRSVDPTRPVVGNDGWEQVVTDIATVHDYSASGDTLRERYGTRAAVIDTLQHVQPGHRRVLLPGFVLDGLPVMITEFGGITLAAATHDNVWGAYGATPDVESFLERYTALVDALLASPAVSGFCYTQLTDTEQEQNGLVTDYRVPKVPVEQLRAVNCRTSAAVPADEIGAMQHGDQPSLTERVPQRPPRGPVDDQDELDVTGTAGG